MPVSLPLSTRIRILVVDDHPMMRAGLARALSMDPGFAEVMQANDGESALDVWRQQRPNVNLLDISMGGMDGIDALRRLVGAPRPAAACRRPARARGSMRPLDWFSSGVRRRLVRPGRRRARTHPPAAPVPSTTSGRSRQSRSPPRSVAEATRRTHGSGSGVSQAISLYVNSRSVRRTTHAGSVSL